MDERTCSVDGCGSPLHVKKAGLCNRHYQRKRKYGDPNGGVTASYTLPCAFTGCTASRRYDQLCMGHYNQQRRGLPLRPLRKMTDPTARDSAGNKQCRRCERWLVTSEFSTNNARPDGLTAYCRRCERDKALIHYYGITIDEYDAMLARQGGSCAICRGQTKDGRSFFVDHDHACCPGQRTCGGCVRGLLCGDCNLGIGYFNDDTTRIQRAITYLQRGPARATDAA